MGPVVKKQDSPEGPLSITLTTTEDGETCSCVKSEDYGNHFSGVVRDLFLDEAMLDVTLCVDGHKIRAHRMVLGACSSFFQELLEDTNDEQTIFIPEVNLEHLQAIVSFCYNGEIRIPSTEITDMLSLAQFLKIEGLREVAGLVESESSNEQGEDEESYVLQEFNSLDDDDNDDDDNNYDNEDNNFNEGKDKKESAQNVSNSDNLKKKTSKSNIDKVIKRRKNVNKKYYNESQVKNALEAVRSGITLYEAAKIHGVPKSTLYMRVKSSGIKCIQSKLEYTIEDIKEAIKSVSAGCSLQHASDMHGVPKTVIWRRIHKEGVIVPKREHRKSYGSEMREAAIKALQRGEALAKVSSEYKIPKTTLFRDKTRLINEGKLPTTCYKKRKLDENDEKIIRLHEAVNACKGGKMSQAAASVIYQIPKTTIWRHLQKEMRDDISSTNVRQKIKILGNDESNIKAIKVEDLNEEEFEPYCPDDSEMSITYIDDENVGSDPVIILASTDGEEISLPEDRQNYVVVQEDTSSNNFVSCTVENYDDASSFTKS